MNEERILEFLKEYAAAASDTHVLAGLLPLALQVSMAGGTCAVVDRNNNPVAFFSVTRDENSRKLPDMPSVPVSPAAIAMAKLFVAAANGLEGDAA